MGFITCRSLMRFSGGVEARFFFVYIAKHGHFCWESDGKIIIDLPFYGDMMEILYGILWWDTITNLYNLIFRYVWTWCIYLQNMAVWMVKTCKHHFPVDFCVPYLQTKPSFEESWETCWCFSRKLNTSDLEDFQFFWLWSTIRWISWISSVGFPWNLPHQEDRFGISVDVSGEKRSVAFRTMVSRSRPGRWESQAMVQWLVVIFMVN